MNGTVLTSIRNGARIIKFNKPAMKNALSVSEFEQVRNILREDSKNNDTKLAILTGEGSFFTSGNDMKAMRQAIVDKDEAYFKNFTEIFGGMIDAVINYPKLLVAVVNGPGVGVGVTILGLCDMVYASRSSYFHMPFVSLGLNAEACASYCLPKIIGKHLATRMIYGGVKIDVDEAYRKNLVGCIFENEKIEEVFEELDAYGGLPVETVKRNKYLVMENDRNNLLECNKRECEMLNISFMSAEFDNAVQKFLGKKNKL